MILFPLWLFIVNLSVGWFFAELIDGTNSRLFVSKPHSTIESIRVILFWVGLVIFFFELFICLPYLPVIISYLCPIVVVI